MPADPLCRSNYVPVDDGALTLSVYAGEFWSFCRGKETDSERNRTAYDDHTLPTNAILDSLSNNNSLRHFAHHRSLRHLRDCHCNRNALLDRSNCDSSPSNHPAD